MKKNILALFLIAGISILKAQTYILDNTFGEGGVKFHQSYNFFPFNGILVNQNYYMTGAQNLIKVDYSGNFVSSFGTNGSILLNPSAYGTFTIKALINSGDYLYVYGYCKTDTTKDIFIYKIGTDGTFDTTFGTNGLKFLDLGGAEYLESMVVEPSGKLFGCGSRNGEILYFKVNADGNLDTTFDANGYKAVLVGTNARGTLIAPYDNGYLISGRVGTSLTQSFPVLLKLDANGVADESFGPSGIKTLNIPSFTTGNFLPRQLFQGKLYLSGSYGPVSSQAKIAIYDITGDTVQITDAHYSDFYFAAYDDGLYINGFNYCGPGNINGCGNEFNLRRKDLNGNPDPTFQNNTVYEYSYPYATDNSSRLFIKGDDGSFMIAGYKKSQAVPNNPSPYNGFMMIRLTQGELATEQPMIGENISVYPNPFSGEIHINTETLIESITLADLSGRIFQPGFNHSGGVYTVNLPSLSQGVYFLIITDADGFVSEKKIIRQ